MFLPRLVRDDSSPGTSVDYVNLKPQSATTAMEAQRKVNLASVGSKERRNSFREAVAGRCASASQSGKGGPSFDGGSLRHSVEGYESIWFSLEQRRNIDNCQETEPHLYVNTPSIRSSLLATQKAEPQMMVNKSRVSRASPGSRHDSGSYEPILFNGTDNQLNSVALVSEAIKNVPKSNSQDQERYERFTCSNSLSFVAITQTAIGNAVLTF